MIGRRLWVRALARLLRRIAPLVQPDRERVEAFERLGLGLDDGLQVVGRFADRLLEQREQQLVLAVEVLVEAAQRLLRPVDDLLDRELGRALLVDQRERGVEEPLDALLGAGAGRVQAARYGPLAPGGLVASSGTRLLSCQEICLSLQETVSVPSRENGISAGVPVSVEPLLSAL